MGGQPRDPGGALLWAAFGAVIAAFGASTAYSQYRAAAIDSAASEIASHATPSIQHLAAARTELHRLRVFAGEYAEGPAPDREEALLGARVAMRAELAAYRQLPFFPGEERLWREAESQIARVDHEVDELTRAASAGNLEEARRLTGAPLREAVDRASAELGRAIDLDTERTRELALRIERVRERSDRIAWWLDLSCGLLAVAAAAVTWRQARRHTRLIQANLRLSEGRAQELEAFAGRVAHDILNPIHAATLSVDVALRRSKDVATGQEPLTRARMSLLRVGRVVAGLLDFARAGAQPSPGARADLKEVVEELALELKPAAAQVGAELLVAPVPACEVACSPGCLSSLVSNLVQNAIKYIGDGPVRRIEVKTRVRDDGHVLVEVSDTGPGLPPGLAASVFEPYVRGENTQGKPGLGLGLATVRRIAEAHGGAVGVRSTPGAGAAFWFEMPSCTEARRAARPPAIPSQAKM